MEAAVRWRADLAAAAGGSKAVGEALQPVKSLEHARRGVQQKTGKIGRQVNREPRVEIEMEGTVC
jgi:hypothetical protein